MKIRQQKEALVDTEQSKQVAQNEVREADNPAPAIQPELEAANNQFQEGSRQHLQAKLGGVAGGVIQMQKDKPKPPTIAEALTYGKQRSATFAVLMLANKITVDNYASVISIGSDTFTDPISGKIVITQGQDIKGQVIKLTQELTNRKNRVLIQKAITDVEQGIIKPDMYASKIMWIEYDGQINQVKVAADIGYQYSGTEYESLNKLIDEYSADKTIDLTKRLKPNQKLKKEYEGKGQQMRNEYQRLHPEKK